MAYDPNVVINPDFRILHYLHNMSAFRGRTYTYVSQARMIVELRRFHGLKLSVRTLQRHLNALVNQFYLKRIRRHYRDRVFGFVHRSTIHEVRRRWFDSVRKTIVNSLRLAKLPAESIALFDLPGPAQYRRCLYKSVVGGSG
jgi:hypothetical protein